MNIKLKWNKLSYEVELAPESLVTELKNKVFELTGVPVDRQKLMAKGAWTGTLKDGDDQSLKKLKQDMQVLLMGTAEVLEQKGQAVVFVEDLSSEQLAVKGVLQPAGLVNLGNTCYMNATLQCLRFIPDLKEHITSSSNVSNSSLATQFVSTFNSLDRSANALPPFSFVQFLRTAYPQFAEMSQSGTSRGYVQQDAEEFFNALVSSHVSFKSFLGIELEETLTCGECPTEPAIVNSSFVNKLIVNISSTVDHMHDGLKLGLEGTVEKNSSVLGRNALWNRQQRIKSLPRYICFQFLRFFWKPTPESRDHTGLKCKILRSVSFPETIDLYDLCTTSLQQTLKRNREDADRSFDQQWRKDQGGAVQDQEEGAMDVEEREALREALQLSMADKDAVVVPSEDVGLPIKGFTGKYELFALVTHKGRSADSGHYIGWVRQKGSADLWHCFDDDKVREVTTEEIMKLKGGGDREMAYLTFYRFKHLP